MSELLLDAVGKRLSAMKIAPASDPAGDMGPIAHPRVSRARARAERCIA